MGKMTADFGTKTTNASGDDGDAFASGECTHEFSNMA